MVFIAYNRTSVIMASGRELCYVLLVGILASYLITFVILAKPSAVNCAVLRYSCTRCTTGVSGASNIRCVRCGRFIKHQVCQVGTDGRNNYFKLVEQKGCRTQIKFQIAVPKMFVA